MFRFWKFKVYIILVNCLITQQPCYHLKPIFLVPSGVISKTEPQQGYTVEVQSTVIHWWLSAAKWCRLLGDICSNSFLEFTICLLLTLSSIHKWHFTQIDFAQAFTQPPISEDIYIKIPQGWNVSRGQLPQDADPKHWDATHCIELEKSLHGIKWPQEPAFTIWSPVSPAQALQPLILTLVCSIRMIASFSFMWMIVFYLLQMPPP